MYSKFNSNDATVTADDPYSLCPAVGEHPLFTSVESTAGGKKHTQNLSPSNLQRQPVPAREPISFLLSQISVRMLALA